jgi:hypothetical protein
MAYVYMMAVRCRNEWVAKALADKYAGQTFTFAGAYDMWGGDVCKFGAIAQLADGEWWVEIVPRGVTSSAISSGQEASRANQFCNVMYGMLRNEKFFDYAIAGVEPGEFRTLQALKEDLASGSARVLDGLVVSKELLAEHGNPEYFADFSETHKWIPKKPEQWPRPDTQNSLAEQ